MVVVGDFTDAATLVRLEELAAGKDKRKKARKNRAVELTPRKVTAAVWACYNHIPSREGVETAEQFNYLNARGVEILQGYFISEPMLSDDFLAFISITEWIDTTA